MKAVVRFSLKQKIFFNLVFVALILAGTFSLLELPAERYPNISFGEVTISAFYPDASPEDVESLVTSKIEKALEPIKHVEWIQSTSYRQYANIMLKFEDDRDYDALYNEVRFHLQNMQKELPSRVNPPTVNMTTVNDYLPVVSVNLVGAHENRALALMGKALKVQLEQISGIQQVQIEGEYEREFHIYLDLKKMRALGISYDEATQALQNANVSIPAGNFRRPEGTFLVKVDEKFRNHQQVLKTIIRKDGTGNFVRIADIASRTELSYLEPAVIVSINGDDALSLKVVKTPSGNAIAIKQAIDNIVAEARPRLEKEGVKLVITQDSTVYINDALNTLGSNMIVGVILVMLIIWYFMGFRNAALVTVGVPFSFMMTMTILYITGNSLNEITLFAFILVSGIIVDDAIVVAENIYRHLQKGNDLKTAIIDGTAEVALPVIAATSTTVAAFLPMLIMSGTTGEFFAQIPTTIAFAIIASLVECLLILPIHYLDWAPPKQIQNEQGKKDSEIAQEKDSFLLAILRKMTVRILKITLRFRKSTVFLLLILFTLAVGILGVSISGEAPLIKIKFFPDDYKIYYVDIEAPSTVAAEAVDKKVRLISQHIMADGPGYASAVSGYAGFRIDDDYRPVFGKNYGTVVVTMPILENQAFDDPLVHLDQIRDRVNEQFKEEGFHYHIHPQKDGPPTGKDINVRVLGTNLASIDALSAEMFRFMREAPEIAPHLVELNDNRGKPGYVFRFHIKQERAWEYGLTPTQVGNLAASVLDGRFIGYYQLSDEEIELKLYVEPQQIKQPEDALYIPLLEHATGPVYLKDLVEIETYMESGSLNRYQGQRAISITANLKPSAPTSTPAIINLVRKHYEQIREQYPGANLNFSGEYEDTQRSYQSLAYAFILAVMVMYMILAAQFQSYVQPLIILSAIVFALIGVVFGKLFTQSLLTVNSFMALLGVAGVVVNDALVLIDFINKRYRAGLSRRQAIEEGVHVRLRPIVLTTLTTSLGLLPMAIGFPNYSMVWGSMASTFVTGLATATALTLFVVPVLWDLLMGLQERLQRRKVV